MRDQSALLIGQPSCCYACGGHLSRWVCRDAFGGKCDECRITYEGKWDIDGTTHRWSRHIAGLNEIHFL